MVHIQRKFTIPMSSIDVFQQPFDLQRVEVCVGICGTCVYQGQSYYSRNGTEFFTRI